jgi:adenylate cyclase
VTQGEAASAVGVSTGTLRRWIGAGVIPEYAGKWTPAALGKARMVARLRERGYTLERIHAATNEGRLAFGQVLELFADQGASRTPRQAAAEAGLEPPVVTLVTRALGMRRGEPISDGDVRLMRYVAAAIDAGFPIEAILQLIRIYGHAIGQIADAEVRGGGK